VYCDIMASRYAHMAFSLSLDIVSVLYTEHTDSTVFSADWWKELRPFREVRVQNFPIPDFEKALARVTGALKGCKLHAHAAGDGTGSIFAYNVLAHPAQLLR
jgi:hypothetical protein